MQDYIRMESEPLRYCFPKKSHLLKQKEFDAVFQAKNSAGNRILVLYGLKNNLGFSRLGLVVSKKLAGKRAVIRNRWKRLIREVFRLSQHEIPTGMDIVVLPKKGAEPDFRQIQDSFQQLLRRVIQKMKTETITG